uniref:SFRICE_018846 n=1 Tax=Spodoptera frugiperda TaxID=7108 RepID=A0A2H1WEF2_SPOFR
MTSQISCIAHIKFACELTRIENPNEQQLGRKPARHDHLAWSEDPPFLRELYSLFPKVVTPDVIETNLHGADQHRHPYRHLPHPSFLR